jgi:ATP-GRASP peptide maturase of grasp-with-spasm system
MILIVSENIDYITDRVIEWLQHYGITDIFRINEDDDVNILEIDINNENVVIEVSGRKLNLSDVDFFWYRRGNLKFRLFPLDINDMGVEKQVVSFLKFEWKICRDYIFHILQQKKSLGNFFKGETNKLINLRTAQQCGLEIPKTLISSNNQALSSFCRKNPSITKPIGENMAICMDGNHYSMFTVGVNNKEFEPDESIFPTLLQNNIDKEFEIRVFILYTEVYAMAIFSQKNEKTGTDFRNYDHQHMNRMIRYKLPDNIVQKLLLFMDISGLDTGSIDMIKTNDNRYIFLEVNPCGNIEMINAPYHFSIEKRIAEIIKNSVQYEN